MEPNTLIFIITLSFAVCVIISGVISDRHERPAARELREAVEAKRRQEEDTRKKEV